MADKPGHPERSDSGVEPSKMPQDDPTQGPGDTHPASDTVPHSNTPSTVGKLHGTFGPYRIVDVLGEGAMGVVYLAEDPKLERQVAIKVPTIPRRQENRRDALLKRFRREALAVAAIHHPNICPIYEVSEVDGTHYMVMGYVEGISLDNMIKRGKRFPIRAVVRLVRIIAMALSHAHQKGVIHRDLKPQNIMINERNDPIIMDFGLARREGKEDTVLTHAGELLGTPCYMSPEQARGDVEAQGPPSDVFSLGVILFELLTGRRPFEGHFTAVLTQIVSKDVSPPSTLRLDCDNRLDEICVKAMAKSPENRFRSMGEFASALEGYLKKTHARSPRVRETEREQVIGSLMLLRTNQRFRLLKQLLFLMTLVIVALAVALVVEPFWSGSPDSGEPPSQQTVPPPNAGPANPPSVVNEKTESETTATDAPRADQ